MRIADTFLMARKGVTSNVSRSMLTMLGIIIGVGAVVLMSGIGASMQKVILSQISSLGSKSMVIFPGREESGVQAVSTGFDALTLEDVERLRKLPSVENISPVIFLAGPSTYGKETASSQVFGVPESFFRNEKIEVTEGRFFTDSDDESANAVAVLAPDAREKLFGNENPVGKSIKVGNRHFTVIGVTKALGSQFFQNADDRIYVPFSVARQETGQRYVNYVTMEATDSFDLAFADVKYLLRERHGIENPDDDPKKDDFVVHSSEEAAAILGAVSLGLTLFITTVAGISLLVGGIGIMNIMIVSVTERTREIGLRKAVGATARNILLQFLIESVLLTLIGGIIGIVAGLGLSFLIALIVERFLDTYAFIISFPSIIAAVFMAGFTGIVFGISPARHAARLHPIDALRYE